MGANIESVEIGRLYVKKNDFVKKGDLLFEIITDKATFEVEADSDGKILQLTCEEGDQLNVLEGVGYIGEEEDLETLKNISSEKFLTSKKIVVTPRAKKLAADKGINLEKEFGGHKIIRERDMQKLISIKDNFSRANLSNRKKREINHLSENKERIISSITIPIRFDKASQKVDEFNTKNNSTVTLGEFISYYAVKELEKFKKLNSYYEEDSILIYDSINLSFALGIGEDLFTPVIGNANKLDLKEFSSQLKKLLFEVIKKKIVNESGSTFTISDLSSYNVLNFYPVINSKQSAILGICARYESFQFIEGEIKPAPLFNLVVSFDHRVVDGKYVSEYLNSLKKILEE